MHEILKRQVLLPQVRTGWGPRCSGQRCLPCSSLFLHFHRVIDAICYNRRNWGSISRVLRGPHSSFYQRNWNVSVPSNGSRTFPRRIVTRAFSREFPRTFALKSLPLPFTLTLTLTLTLIQSLAWRQRIFQCTGLSYQKFSCGKCKCSQQRERQ